jgi:hypothetical protein
VRASFRFSLSPVALATVAAVRELNPRDPDGADSGIGLPAIDQRHLVTFDMAPVPGGAVRVDGASVAVRRF